MPAETVLTGITTTGTPHLGNYIGAIDPAIEASRSGEGQYYFFLADFHGLVKCPDPERIKQSTLEIAATWLALGLDTERSVFYRQSDIPEIPELTWVLTCQAPKGLLNRAHAYKAAVQENQDRGESDLDRGISMGLFNYPVLMAADILMFNADKVPVGEDQTQHLEMARDIAGRFNHRYGELFTLPQAAVDKDRAVLPGLDGRKMSKSYNNIIPLWAPAERLRKLIRRIKTTSQGPEEPKDPDTCTLFAIYRAFATPEQTARMRERYAEGIAWGQMKDELFEHVNAFLEGPRQRYEALIDDPGYVEEVLRAGAERAREHSRPFLDRIREAVGIGRLDR